MTGREACVYLSLKYKGEWEEIYRAIREKERPDWEEFDRLKATNSGQYVTLCDAEYPQAFKVVEKPPFAVFYHGDWSLVKESERTVSYVGSRNASAYGLQKTREIVTALAKKGVVIVTGLAKGIDAEAAKAALEAGGKVIAVLGNGIDYCYPSSNKELYEKIKATGLVLSEYPGLTPPDKSHFPLRNRLVASLGKGLVVGEASKKSGTLITVGQALSLNKEVGCLPYEATGESGCNMLIKEGAYLLENAQDVLAMIGLRGSERAV